MSTQTTTTATMINTSVDPASLRAAALSTLKKKAKKSVKHIPDFKSTFTRPPPPPSDSFLLDYGPDESSQDVQMKNLSAPKSEAPVEAPIEQDVAMREEGEISDEEGVPPLQAQPTTGPGSPVPPSPLEPPAAITSSSSTTRSGSPEFQQISSVSLIDRIFSVPNKEPKQLLEEDVAMSGDQPNDIVMDYIRPGIALTQEEYDTVKDIILDLLGWGVPPTAIMESGVSREVMFYVFNELNLRLPEDFDYSGIAPYIPATLSEPMKAIESSVSEHSTFSSLSQEPERLPEDVPPATTSNDVDATLLDMEQQRRKELLARKAAVLASRKNKKTNAPSKTSSVSTEPTVPSLNVLAKPVASEAVDDFLNSIGPSQLNGPETNVVHTCESGGMEVDKIEAHNDSVQIPEPTHVPDEPHDLVSIVDEPFVEPPLPPAGPPPWSCDSTMTTFSDLPIRPYTETINPTTRRGTKRPVASDFVDMEPTRYINEPATNRRIQKLPRFTNLQPMRCVIDLSDDEDSDVEHPTPLPSQPVTPMPFEPRTAGARPLKRNSTAVPGASILHLKELEIQRMREMIARKEEETRLKKLAASQASLSRSVSATPVLSAPSPFCKEENGPDTNMDISEQPSAENQGDGHDGVASINTEDVSNDEPQESAVSPSASEPPEEESLAVTPSEEEELEVAEVSVHADLDDVDVEQRQLASAQATSMSPLDHLKPEEKRTAVSEHDTQLFSEYHPTFALYPRLSQQVMGAASQSSTKTPNVSFFTSTKISDSSPTTSFGPIKIDLQPLKSSVIVRSIDPLKRLCQYEIPGPGVCRDKDCDDIHLSKVENTEPDDSETADYVFRHLPRDWAKAHQVESPSAIFQALQAVHQQNFETLTLDERVNRALLSIESMSTT